MSRHFLVIGGQRCGTTTLHGLLDAHPQITMARPTRPEPKVFCSDEATARGPEWYRRTYFGHAGDEVLLGDKSTSYLEDPAAPMRAARMLGQPHVVVLLRDPLERAVSNWRFSTDSGMEDRPLSEALEDNLRERRPWDRQATSVSPYAYLERGRYADHLRPWLDQFPDRIHVLFLADLADAPGPTVCRLFTDLGVDPGPVTAIAERIGIRNRSHRPADELDPRTVDRIRDHFADSDEELTAMLGVPLPWPSRSAASRRRR